MGDINGDFAFSVAAIVRAGSRQRNNAAVNKNLPRWTSVGNFESSRPIGVISSEGVKARTLNIIEETEIVSVQLVPHLNKY